MPEWNGLVVVEGSTLTINDTVGGGKVDAGACAVACDGGTLVINGGNYSGGDYSLWLQGSSPNATINNGTFDGVGVHRGQLTINGGRIETFEFYSTVVITGGTHGSDPTSYVDTENYTVTNNGDGTYTVTAK